MKVAALWSGGKDSALACYKALKHGFDVAFVMTFIWDKQPSSHPLAMTKLQSEALQIPFYWERVNPPYFESYKQAMLDLKEDYGIEGVVTGDISLVDSFHGNWIDNVCKDTGVEVIKPLWDLDRIKIVEDLVSSGFKVIFTCVKQPWFSEEWLGRGIDAQTLHELKELNEKTGMDICGENGEYHTMTVDAPFYKKTINVSKFETEKRSKAYVLKPVDLSLAPK
jgi:diphthine-ammonia ligase